MPIRERTNDPGPGADQAQHPGIQNQDRANSVEVQEFIARANEAPIQKGRDFQFNPNGWHGRKQWYCRHCAFDTLKGEQLVRQHIYAVHFLPVAAQQAQTRPIEVELYGPAGQQIFEVPGQ